MKERISKREIMLWTFYSVCIIFLFLLSSTNLIIKEKGKEIFRVSVVIDDSKDDYYVNYRKGMDQAAIDYNIDVSFITLYQRNQEDQQEDMIHREISDGAEALVIAPVNPSDLTLNLRSTGNSVPVIIINNELPTDAVQENVAADYFEQGQDLAEQIILEHGVDNTFFVFTEGLKLSSNSRFYDGIYAVLQENNCSTTLVDQQENYGYEGILSNVIRDSDNKKVVIALDPETLTHMAALLEETPENYDKVLLYGRGSTMKILNSMDKGIIQGISTINWYDMGYLSMEKAVEAIRHQNSHETYRLDSFYLKKEDIRRKEYEKMLYPIG